MFLFFLQRVLTSKLLLIIFRFCPTRNAYNCNIFILYKAIVKKTAETVQSKSVPVTETFLNAGMQRRSRNSYTIPKCIKTPKKSKIKEVILPKRPSELRLQIDDFDED